MQYADTYSRQIHVIRPLGRTRSHLLQTDFHDVLLGLKKIVKTTMVHCSKKNDYRKYCPSDRFIA